MKQIFIALFGFFLIAASLNDARKANDAYKSGDFETAVELYRQAIESNPDDARLHFNLGSALAKLGSAEEAVQSFERAKQLMDDPRRQSMADYNAGTALSEAEMYDEALNFFRSSLRNNPEDEDAKHNYEMAIQKQQEQEQQDQDDQDQDQDQDEDDNDENEQDQNQDQDNNQQDQDQDQNQDQNQDQSDQQSQDNQQDGSPEEQDSDGEQMPQPDQITQEEAENILNALEQLERDILENRKKEAEDPSSSNDKDW